MTKIANEALDVEQTLEEAFPEVDAGFVPYGSRVLVQVRAVKERITSSGLVLPEETKEIEKWNTQIAKVIAIGPIAFCHRDSLKPWGEGAWAKVGDFIRIIKFGGDRWEVPFVDSKGAKGTALFCVFNDHELIGKITADPRTIRSYI